MYGHRPKNKGIGMVGKTPKHRDPDEPVRSTYVYDPKNNVNNRAICKQCVYREGFGNGYEHMCTCFLRTGVMRDLNPTNEHCETFKKRR